MRTFWTRFRDRKIAQWTLGSAAGAWLVREVVGEVGPAWGLSDAALRGLDVALLFGVFIAAVLAWHHGDRGRQRVGLGEGVTLAILVVVGAIAVRAAVLRSDASRGDGFAEDEFAAIELATLEPYRASVAVLPFRGGDDTAGDTFEDGLAEELINTLGRVPTLRVAARGSSFAFRGDVDPRLVADSLSVEHVLEGSVRRSGDRVRVGVTLVDASSGLGVWSESFDGDLRDVFALQDSIARSIAAELEVAFARGAEEPNLTALPRTEAAELYMLGTAAWHRRSEAELLRSRDLFAEAARIAPDMARAHAGLALAYAVLPQYSAAVSADTAVVRALAAAARAEALDPTLAEPHAARCQVAVFYTYDWETGERECAEAIRLRPSYATAAHWYSELLMARGHLEEAAASVERARTLDPLAPLSHHHRAVVLELMGRSEEALEQLRWNARRYPDFGHTGYVIVVVMLGDGRFQEAADYVAGRDGMFLPGGFATDTAEFRAYATTAAAGDTAAAAAAAEALVSEITEPRLRLLMEIGLLGAAGLGDRLWRVLAETAVRPDPVVLRINALRKYHDRPEYRRALEAYGLEPSRGSSEP